MTQEFFRLIDRMNGAPASDRDRVEADIWDAYTVNVAYKLGEDVARPGEVLLTAAARGRLGNVLAYPLAEQHVSISGLDLATYRVTYQGNP